MTLPLNGRPRSGFRRPSPGPPLSQPQSQSSSEFGLSLTRTDSGGRTNTDLSETSTTEDYVTANTSTETGTTTGTSATTSSWSKPPQTSSAAASASATATAAEGSSFESASSIYSLARSEVSFAILSLGNLLLRSSRRSWTDDSPEVCFVPYFFSIAVTTYCCYFHVNLIEPRTVSFRQLLDNFYINFFAYSSALFAFLRGYRTFVSMARRLLGKFEFV